MEHPESRPVIADSHVQLHRNVDQTKGNGTLPQGARLIFLLVQTRIGLRLRDFGQRLGHVRDLLGLGGRAAGDLRGPCRTSARSQVARASVSGRVPWQTEISRALALRLLFLTPEESRGHDGRAHRLFRTGTEEVVTWRDTERRRKRKSNGRCTSENGARSNPAGQERRSEAASRRSRSASAKRGAKAARCRSRRPAGKADAARE